LCLSILHAHPAAFQFLEDGFLGWRRHQIATHHGCLIAVVAVVAVVALGRRPVKEAASATAAAHAFVADLFHHTIAAAGATPRAILEDGMQLPRRARRWHCGADANRLIRSGIAR